MRSVINFHAFLYNALLKHPTAHNLPHDLPLATSTRLDIRDEKLDLVGVGKEFLPSITHPLTPGTPIYTFTLSNSIITNPFHSF